MNTKRDDILFKDEVYEIIGAAIEVHMQLGSGFLEAVYQEAMEKELAERQIPFHAQTPIRIYYKSKPLDKEYIADFLCYSKIIVELKAMDKTGTREQAQLINYLKASRHRLGLLINFGSRHKLQWERLIL